VALMRPSPRRWPTYQPNNVGACIAIDPTLDLFRLGRNPVPSHVQEIQCFRRRAESQTPSSLVDGRLASLVPGSAHGKKLGNLYSPIFSVSTSMQPDSFE
jgi:hypothetical protein